MICEWAHQVSVRASGDVDVRVDVVAVNTSNKPISEFRFPLYLVLDSKGHYPTVPIWAEFGKKRVNLEPAVWSVEDNVGIVRIPLQNQVTPREPVKFAWGYSLAKVYDRGGNHWFEWHIGRPHDYLRIAFAFDRPWLLSAVSASVVDHPEIDVRARVVGRGFRLLARAPLPLSKYRIDWHLERPDDGLPH
jgi:hypothetical protein